MFLTIAPPLHLAQGRWTADFKSDEQWRRSVETPSGQNIFLPLLKTEWVGV
jgi:hypothetical protein